VSPQPRIQNLISSPKYKNNGSLYASLFPTFLTFKRTGLKRPQKRSIFTFKRPPKIVNIKRTALNFTFSEKTPPNVPIKVTEAVGREQLKTKSSPIKSIETLKISKIRSEEEMNIFLKESEVDQDSFNLLTKLNTVINANQSGYLDLPKEMLLMSKHTEREGK
jgi:hypothetical protein